MNQSTAGALAVLLTAVLWGTTGTAATFAPDVSALAIGAVAMGVGGLLQAAIALPALIKARTQLRGSIGIVLLGAASVAVYPLAFYGAMRLGGVAIGTVISLASAPLASAVLERLIDGKRLTRQWMAAAVLGVGGSVLLCLPNGAQTATTSLTMVLSAMLGLVAGIAYAVYSWAIQRLMQRGITRAASMGAVFGCGGLALIPVLLLTGAPIIASAQSVAVAAYLALVPMFLGYLLFGLGLARIRASTATTITLCEPAVAALLAVAVLGEQLSPAGWTGLVLITLGLIASVGVPGAFLSARAGRARMQRLRSNEIPAQS